MSWLLLVVLGIIWVAFLIPSRRRSPTSTVEEFEQRMNLLAEANKAGVGRWVLMPRRGRKFLGPKDRQRMRMRRRRRLVLVGLLEATGLTLLMGLFPPFRVMLYATAVLAGMLILYTALLVRVRADELAMDRRYRAEAAAAVRSRRANEVSGAIYSGHAYGNAYGNGHGHRNGNGHPAGRSPYAPDPLWETQLFDERLLMEDGLEVIDDDVHVIIRRSDEVDLKALRAAGSTPGE